VKKPHEQPSIGVLLCATKNHEIVEYALSRSMSPALVSEYQTRLPDKKMLQAKLHEFYALAESQAEAVARGEIAQRPVVQLPAAPRKRKVRKKS
jgi:YhcG PDDEXK nuclease domain